LFQRLGKSCRYAAPVDSTDLQRNRYSSRVFKKPVRASTAMHPANDAPCSMPISQDQRDGFGTELRNSVVVMLIDLAHVGARPRQGTVAQYLLQV
jgi:hypothetical protein